MRPSRRSSELTPGALPRVIPFQLPRVGRFGPGGAGAGADPTPGGSSAGPGRRRGARPGRARPRGASRGRGGGAAASSSSPPPPQGPRRSLRGGGAHNPRRAACLEAAAAIETHPRRDPPGLSALPGRCARVPRARSLTFLLCGQLRHGVGVGGAGGGGAGLRQPVPAGEQRRVPPRTPDPGPCPPAASGLSRPACGRRDAAAWRAAPGLGGPGAPRARIRGCRGPGPSLGDLGRHSGCGRPLARSVSRSSRSGRVPESEAATLWRHRPGGLQCSFLFPPLV